MDETQAGGDRGHPGDQTELPERRVTVNMLVGYNMAYFRKAAGLTQEQLGELLGGWTKVAVSAAERSWDGRRVRKFDADEITGIAQALDIPIAALFLPPEDDLTQYRYLIGGSEQDEGATMRDLLTYAMSEPAEDDTPAMRAYEERLVTAVNKYLDSGVAEMLATRLKERAAEEKLAKALGNARRSREALEYLGETLEDLFSDNQLLQNFLTTMLKATPEGQALMEDWERRERGELTEEERRIAWENLQPQHREWQRHLAGIASEMFGERGPASRGEVNQVVAEARKRGIEGPEAAAVLLRHDGTYDLVRPPGTTGEGEGP